MINIVENPIKKLFIGERIFYDKVEDLASVLALSLSSGQPVALYWAEGIVYIVSPAHPDSDIMVEKYLEGEMHWSSVAYAKLGDFKEHIRIKGMEIPVIDASRAEIMREIAIWLKQKIPK